MDDGCRDDSCRWGGDMSLYAFMLAQEEVTAKGFGGHLGNLIFMGCFFIALMIAAIWWLRR